MISRNPEWSQPADADVELWKVNIIEKVKNRHTEIDIAVAISEKMRYNNQGSCYFQNQLT